MKYRDKGEACPLGACQAPAVRVERSALWLSSGYGVMTDRGTRALLVFQAY